MDFSATLTLIRAFSIDDRIRLVQTIWDDIAAEQNQAELSDAQKSELDRRLADDDEHPEDGIPWEEIKAAASARAQR